MVTAPKTAAQVAIRIKNFLIFIFVGLAVAVIALKIRSSVESGI